MNQMNHRDSWVIDRAPVVVRVPGLGQSEVVRVQQGSDWRGVLQRSTIDPPLTSPDRSTSRGGIAWIIHKYQARTDDPHLADADVSPHPLRHSKANAPL